MFGFINIFLGHHPFTNLTEDTDLAIALDPDVSTNDPDVRRIKPHQKWYDRYKWQLFYVPFLYGLIFIKYRINDFIIMFITRREGVIHVNPPDFWHWTIFISGKLFFVFFRIIWPLYYISLGKTFLIFMLSDLITSYIYAFVFQVNHVVEVAQWPTVNKENGYVDMDWAEMQVKTTLDYAHDSWWTTFLTGALNYQTVHHLFPYVSQIYYMDIGPIVKQHCKQYNIQFNELPSYWDALKAHLSYLSVMGHQHQ